MFALSGTGTGIGIIGLNGLLPVGKTLFPIYDAFQIESN
jgi:hypothetical protein